MMSLLCAGFIMTMDEARFVAEHPSRFPLTQAVCAVEQLRPPPMPLPENPSPRFIAENPSRYSILEVMRAIRQLKAQP